MALYRLYFLTPSGRLIRREEIAADSDDDARRMAERPGDPCVRELWLGGALVSRVTPKKS